MEGKMKATHVYRKQKLELAFGVHIADDAIFFAAQLLQAYGNESTLLKNMDVMRLVERACRMMRRSLDSNIEERNLNWDEYYLDRAFVEVKELRKEKSVACRSVILPRVEKELAECRSKLECFQNKWAPVVAQLSHEAGKRVVLLRCLRHEMVSLMKRTKLQENTEADYLLQLFLPLLSTATNQLLHTVHSAFKERLFVGPCEVAKVASSLTDLPLNYLYWPFKPRLMPRIEDLKSRLMKKLIELDDVIDKIARALSKQKSLMGPFGSFLLLGPHGCGRTRLAKALAEEIFGDEDRCIKLDMSEFTEPDYVSDLLLVLDRHKKHGSVVMFDNIENAHACTYEVLSQILRDGKLTGEEGTYVSFSDDLVLVSSHIGHEAFCNCGCLHTIPKIPVQEILKEPAILHSEMSYKTCYLHRFFTKVANQFEVEFVDLFNDVVIFPWLTRQDHLAICRLQMRDAATSMNTLLKKQVILYPSDAFVQNIICSQDIIKRGAHAYETWNEVCLEPMLNDVVSKNEADDMIIIYADALVGLKDKFSFRVEKSRHLEKYQILKSFKENLWKLRSRYRREKLQVNQIYRLQTSCFQLLELMRAKTHVDAAHVLIELEDVVRLIEDLLMNELSDSKELELVQMNDFNGEVECSPCDRDTERDKICLKRVAKRLRSSSEQGDKATQVIMESLLRHIKTSYDHQSNKSNLLPASFLCLGLTPQTKKQFAKSLREHLVMDDGRNLLIQVDLSQCTKPDSFFWCAYDMDTRLLLTKAVQRRPHSVIIFHQLEKAHMSVFSTILSILDDGVSKDNDGNITNFGNSVVVIVSDLGNKEIVGGLNGHRPAIKWPIDRMEIEYTSKGEAVVGSSLTDEMGSGLLRFELLYRLDHLLLFDPFSGDQLNQFATAPMKSLEEKSHSLHVAFFRLFDVHGKKNRSDNPDEIIKYIEEALGKVVKIRYDEHQGIPGSGDSEIST